MKGKKLLAHFKDYTLILAAIVISAYYLTSKVDPTRMDADLIVQSLASLKYLTLFYWAQDRLASLVPLIISPIKNINENLYANVFTQAALFSSLIFYFIKTISSGSTSALRENKKIYIEKLLFIIPCYFSSIVLISYLVPESDLFTFTKHAQPYAASTLLMLCAYKLYKVNYKVEAQNNKRLSIIILLLMVSLILNPLSLFLGASLWTASLVQALTIERRKTNPEEHSDALWAIFLVFSSLCYLIINQLYLENYSVGHTTLAFKTSNIIRSLQVITPKLINSFNENTGGLIAIVLICIYVFTRHTLLILINQTKTTFKESSGHNHQPSEEKLNIYFCLGTAIWFNLLSLIPILGSEYLALNDYPLRYLFPLYLVVFYSIAHLSADTLKSATKLGMYADTISITANYKQKFDLIPILITSLCLSIFLGNSRPLSPSLLTYKEVSEVEPAYNYLLQHKLLDSYLGGNYWASWPLKALALSNGLDMAVITDRSKFDPISHQSELRLTNDIRQSRQILYHCVAINENDLVTCKNYLRNLIKESLPSPQKHEIIATKLFTSNLNQQISIYRITATKH